MTVVSKASAYPKSVQSGLPRLGNCPPGWSMCRLGDLLQEYRVKSTIQDQHEVLTSSRSGLILQSDYYSGERITSRDNVGFHVVPPNYMTYRSRSDDGEFFINMNKLGRYGIVSHFYPVFRFLSDERGFFLDFLNYHRHQLGIHSVGSSQRVLSLNALREIILPIPPAGERQKIAEILSTWDRAIETVEALIANARKQKTALMQVLLSGRTRLPGFDAEWLRKRLGDFVAPERSKCEPQSLGSEVRVIELEHIEAQTGRIIGTALAREQASLKTPFTPNHVLYGKLRPYLRKFARPTFSGVCSTEIWALSANPAYCTPGFLNLLVQTTTFDGAVNISAGSKMPRAEWGVVAEASVALPSLPEQLAISGLMETVSAELENREEQLGALRQEKAALMQQLLTGKRRVKLAESEAA